MTSQHYSTQALWRYFLPRNF